MLGKNEIKRIDPKEHVCVIIWSVDDVLEQAHELGIKCSQQEAETILDQMEDKHDSSMGISWDTIIHYLCDLQEERERVKAEKRAREKVSFS